jgi:hypothetical protein
MDLYSQNIQKMWASSNRDVRIRSLEKLYEDDGERTKLFKYLLARTGSIEDAEDILQQTFCNIQEVLNDHPINVTFPGGYFWRTAHNLLVEWYKSRKKRKEIPLDDASAEQLRSLKINDFKEEKIDIKWIKNDALKLVPHLKKEKHRWLGTLLYSFGLTGKRVQLLTGQELKVIQYADKQIKKHLRMMWLHERKTLLTEPDPWSKQLSFTGDNSPVCVARMNISPIIHKDSMKKLYKDFQVSSEKQFRERVACMIRCELGLSQIPILTFLPREYFSKEVLFHEKRLKYMACIPLFERDERGKLVLTLPEKYEFSGRIVGGIQSDERGVWTEIIYEFPELHLKARKAFRENLLHHYLNPDGRREPITYLYRLYPNQSA